MFKLLNLFWGKKAAKDADVAPVPEHLDLFSEKQCKLDDARLVFHCMTLDVKRPDLQGLIDYAWREIGRELFADGRNTNLYRIGN